MAVEPGDHLGMLMGDIVVKDHMDGLLRRHGAFDDVEDTDELLVPVALHTPAR